MDLGGMPPPLINATAGNDCLYSRGLAASGVFALLYFTRHYIAWLYRLRNVVHNVQTQWPLCV